MISTPICCPQKRQNPSLGNSRSRFPTHSPFLVPPVPPGCTEGRLPAVQHASYESYLRCSLRTYHTGDWRPFFNFVSVCAAVQLQRRPLSSAYTLPAQTHASQHRSVPCYPHRQGYCTHGLRGAARGRRELLELQGHRPRSLLCGVTKTLGLLWRCCARISR